MRCYLVCFEKTGTHYDDFYDAIMGYELWAHLAADSWAISCDMTAQEVYEDLWQHMDENDRLIVVQTNEVAAWTNLHCDDNWLHENL